MSTAAKKPAKDHGRLRFEIAAAAHWIAARKGFKQGELLFAVLDAALRKLTPRQELRARENVLQVLRRRAARARGQRTR
jgi:hypothetical protein